MVGEEDMVMILALFWSSDDAASVCVGLYDMI